MTEPHLGELGQLFKDIVVRIVAVPHLMVLGLTLFFAVLSVMFGAPIEIALNFFLEATGTVVVLQAKMLMVAGAIAAPCFFVGAFRLDVLACYLAERLTYRIKGLALFWASMLAGVRPLFPLPTAPVLRDPRLACATGARAGFVPGHAPQLE